MNLNVKTRRGKLDIAKMLAVWKVFAKYVKPHTKALVLALAGALGAVAMQVASPWPIKVVFDYILSTDIKTGWLAKVVDFMTATPVGILGCVCISLLLIAVLDALFSHVRDVSLAQTGQRVVGSIRRDLFAHLQTMPPSVLEKRRTGDLLMRLTGDIQMLRQMMVNAMITICQSFLTIAAMVCAMFWLNPGLAIIGVTTVPVTLFAAWRISKKIRKATKSQREKESAVVSIAHDVIGALPTVQAFNREEAEQKRFSRQNRSSVRAGVKTTKLQSKLFRVVAIASAAATCGVLYVGVGSVLKGGMTAGDLLVFIAYLRGLNKPIRRAAKVAGQVAKASACGQRVAELFAMKAAVADKSDAQDITDGAGALAIREVCFSYDADSQVLTNVSIAIRAGERVAIVGRSGAGKSTLAKLLLRFYDPDAGTVEFDGQDIRELKLASLRREIGWVHQETVLFGMTIAENIALGSPDADRKAIRSIARKVGADSFIKAKPDGYATLLGQGGQTLSGGQRQLVSLARAMLCDPSILLLDEPAAGLDAVSRQRVEDAWLSPANEATTIVICHRLRDMQRFDRVIVLRDGLVVQDGPHKDLVSQDGEYASLWHAHSGSKQVPMSREEVA